MCSSFGQHDQRIGGCHIGPARWQRFESTIFIIEKHAVLSPGLANRQQLESTAEHGVKWMSDLNDLLFTITTVCS